MVREEGKLDLASASDDTFHDGLVVPPPSASAELVSSAHSGRSGGGENQLFVAVEKQTDKSLCCCRSASACVSPLADAEAGELSDQSLGAMASALMRARPLCLQVLQEIVFLPRGLKASLRMATSFR